MLGWLPVSFLVADALTPVVAGWERPTEITGCDARASCSEPGAFFTVLAGVGILWPVVAVLLFRRVAHALDRSRGSCEPSRSSA